MSVFLTLKCPESTATYVVKYDSEDAWIKSGFPNAFAHRSSPAIFTPFVIPIRMNNLRNFSKDFFLPTTVNFAIKIDRFALRLFVVIGCIILDLITFPIRLLTALPWKAWAPQKENHKLYNFLLKQQVPKNVLEGDYICVKICKVGTTQHNRATKSKNLSFSSRDIHYFRCPLNLVPFGEIFFIEKGEDKL